MERKTRKTKKKAKKQVSNEFRLNDQSKQKKLQKMFLLQCPKCRNKMKYQSKDIYLAGKKKKCVYCGFSMSASKYIVKKI